MSECSKYPDGYNIRANLTGIYYPDDSGISDMAVELKEMTDLDGLLPPIVPANTPRKRELKRTAVQGAISVIRNGLGWGLENVICMSYAKVETIGVDGRSE